MKVQYFRQKIQNHAQLVRSDCVQALMINDALLDNVVSGQVLLRTHSDLSYVKSELQTTPSHAISNPARENRSQVEELILFPLSTFSLRVMCFLPSV